MVWNVKKTYRKSCPANLLQVPNLTFDPCSKVKLGNHTQRFHISLIFSSRALTCDNNLVNLGNLVTNLFQVSNLTFEPCFNVMCGFHTEKNLLSPLLLVLGPPKCENNFWEIMPCNLLQVSNLTFDPCFKVKLGNHTQRSYISLIF